MWLLKFHLAFSILCLITFLGFRMVFRQQIINNGWADGEKQKRKMNGYLLFFVPILNVLTVVLYIVMISVKKADYDKFVEENKKKD